MRAMLTAAVLGMVVLGIAIPVEASNKVRCDVLAIEASTRGQGIDMSLAEHATILRRPPFAAFDTFRLVSRYSYDLDLGVPAALSLPAPLNGSLTLNSQNQGRLDLTLVIARPQAAPVAVHGKASPGSPLFAAGFKSGSGTWIFGVICNRNETINH